MPLRIDSTIEDRDHPTQAAVLSALSHPEHIWLHDYWLKRKPQGGVPSRRDIDPTDFPRLLPRVAVIGVDLGHDGLHCQYRYRLAGTEIVARAGRDPTGKTFAELYEGDYLRRAQALYDGLRDAAEPYFSRRAFPVEGAEGTLTYDRLILPLAADHRRIDQFLLLIAVVDQGGGDPCLGKASLAGLPRRF